MYIPSQFREEDTAAIHEVMRAAKLCQFVTATSDGLMATPMPMLFEPGEGDHGVLYGHLARANPQWGATTTGDAMVIFTGPDAYVTPSWYETKAISGKVVPTWNYVAIHAYGPAEFFDDAGRLLDVVTRLTQQQEHDRPSPWAVSDAPETFVASQLRGIVGVRIPISRIDAKTKMSQNRNLADRKGVAEGLQDSRLEADRIVGSLVAEKIGTQTE